MTFKFLKSTRLWSVLLVMAALYGGYRAADHYVPARHLPWKPLSLTAETGYATKTQLLKLALSSRKQCIALLEREAVDTVYGVLPEKRLDNGCGWQVALRATRNNDIGFSPSEMTALCPVTVAANIWLREVDRIALDKFGSGINRIHHFGTYSCRNIAGSSRLSEHAFANAWDISGFELDDGRLISVLKDWDGNTARMEFLRQARDEACGLFRVVLSPDYNAAHKDHFHFDMGPSTTCR